MTSTATAGRPAPSAIEHDPTDAALLRLLRAGDMEAAASLYLRHHQHAVRIARSIANVNVADDLVSEAFVRILAAVRQGRGPDQAFRAYLVTTIRHLFVDSLRAASHEVLVGDDLEVRDGEAWTPDCCDSLVESLGTVELLADLPARWQEILWRTVVLGEPLAQAGASMGLNANAAAALSFRARGGLARAYRARTLGEDGTRRMPRPGSPSQQPHLQRRVDAAAG